VTCRSVARPVQTVTVLTVMENQPPGRSRVAVVATPRSGNTWLRGLLAELTDSAEIAEHTPREISWDRLPERTILQIHWYPTGDFQRQLDEAGFKVVTIARHPLDVLMSILHFCRHEVLTDRWLDGRGGNERALAGAGPLDWVVRDYAAAPRFRQLLGVSEAWWCRADAVVRYEDLVAEPEETLRRLVGELGLDVGLGRVPRIVDSRRIETMRVTNDNHHYWQGTPGGWRRLLPADAAQALAASVEDLLRAGGYVVDPLPGLDAERARRNWAAVEVPGADTPPAGATTLTPARRVASWAFRNGRRKHALEGV
jgi:hypothetical protein